MFVSVQRTPGDACPQRSRDRPRLVAPCLGVPPLARRFDGRQSALAEEVDLLGAAGIVVEDTLQAVVTPSVTRRCESHET